MLILMDKADLPALPVEINSRTGGWSDAQASGVKRERSRSVFLAPG
jgi:hypothetical protein